MQQQLYGSSYRSVTKLTMPGQQRNGQMTRHLLTFNPGKTRHSSGLSFLLIIVLLRMASSMRKQIIQDFQRQLYKTCGIRSLVFTAYEGEDNDLKICL